MRAIVFVDDMDGDVYESMQDLYDGICVAILNDTRKIEIRIESKEGTWKDNDSKQIE